MSAIEPTKQPILLFCEGISYAHISRSLIFAQWLTSLNHSIVIACPQTASSLFAAEGFKTIEIETADPVKIYNRLRQGGSIHTKEDLLNYFEQDDHLLQKVQPCIIISEFRFTILQLAKKYKIPAVGMTEATCHPHFVPDSHVPKSLIREVSLPYQEASTTYGVEVLPTFFHYASQGDLCLLCDHPALIPIETLRPHDLYTGALIWNRPEPLPNELSQLNPATKTVYVSLGTQESLPTDFLDTYIEKLLEQDLQVIVSLGKRSLEMSAKRDNLFVFDFVNDSKLLPIVDLMVYPGGAMSTYQALSCGVPLIALPAHANQLFYAEAIVRNNLGYLFRPSDLKLDELVNTTLRIVKEPKTYASTQAFQKKIADLNPRETILNRIMDLMNGTSSAPNGG